METENYEDSWVDINPEYVYMTVPAEYVCIYHRLLILFADFGIDLIKDCKASCNNRNSQILNCFNMFNAAVAARHLNNDKEAELLIKYIDAQLKSMYNGIDNSHSIVFPVDENGELKAIVGCGSTVKFRVKTNTGNLIEKKIVKDNSNEDIYSLGDEDLISE